MAEARFELAGNRLDLIAALQAAGLAIPLTPKSIARSGDVRVTWVGPRRWLICAPLSAAPRIHAAMAEAIPRTSSSLLADVSGSTETILVSGAHTIAVLEQGIAHDLSIESFPAGSVLATEGWGIGLLLERDGEQVRVTADVSLAAYLSNCLNTAAGQSTDVVAGVMRAPPPAIAVSS